jgi:ATP-binding cassette subfamily B protein
MNAMRSRLRPFLRTVRRALSFVWDSSPRLAIGSLIVRVLQGLLPLLVLYLTKLLIDAVTDGLKTPADETAMPHITLILGGLAGVAVASAMLTVVTSLLAKIQAQVVTDHMHALLQAKSVEVDLEYYENAQYQDTLHRAQQEAPSRPTAILHALLQFGQDAISLLAMGGILWWLHWAIIPVLLVTAVPSCGYNSRTGCMRGNEHAPRFNGRPGTSIHC